MEGNGPPLLALPLYAASGRSPDPCITVWYNTIMKRKLTAIRLDPEQVKGLQRIGKRENCSVSWLLRRAVDEYLKRVSRQKRRV
jgi:hypothetical protein